MGSFATELDRPCDELAGELDDILDGLEGIRMVAVTRRRLPDGWRFELAQEELGGLGTIKVRQLDARRSLLTWRVRAFGRGWDFVRDQLQPAVLGRLAVTDAGQPPVPEAHPQIERRRQLVLELKLQGYTHDEIKGQLQKLKMNYTIETIKKDVAWLRKEGKLT